MCRPTKRPKPLAALAAATAATMPAMPMYEAAEMIEPMDFSKEFETFVFDLKEDPSISTKPTTPTLTEEVVVLAEPQQLAVTMEMPAEVKLASLPTAEDDRPKTFVYAAFEMVSDTKNAAAIGFNDDGTMIEIRDLDLLSEKILPSYFRHKNITSFYRQLNSYGFRTTRSSTPGVVHAFSHELFRIGREDLLANISRKKCLKKEARLAAKKEMEMNAKHNGANPPSPMSISSSGSSEDILMLEASRDGSKPVSSELESSKAAVLMLQEKAQVLEAANRSLREESNTIFQQGSKLISAANQNAEVYRSLIDLLFGSEASSAFAEQSTPFLMDQERLMAASPSMSMLSPAVVPMSDIQEMGNNNTPAESLFEDDDLALLESIFA